MGGLAPAAIALICLLAVAPLHVSAITCSQVVPYIAPCVGYVRGAPLTQQCCNGVRGLNSAARTTADRQQACTCLKNAARAVGGINPGKVSGLPAQCGVQLPYPVNANVDCSKVR